jgi:hypothetical protein
MDPAISAARYLAENVANSFWDDDTGAMQEAEKVANAALGAGLGALLAGMAGSAKRSHDLRNLVSQIRQFDRSLPVVGPGITRLTGLKNMRLNDLARHGMSLQDAAFARGAPADEIQRTLKTWLAPEAARAGASTALMGAGLGAGLGKAFQLAKKQQKKQKLYAYAPPAVAALLGAKMTKD